MPTRRFLEPIAITVGSQLLQILNKQDLITLLAVNQFIHQIPRQQNAKPPRPHPLLGADLQVAGRLPRRGGDGGGRDGIERKPLAGGLEQGEQGPRRARWRSSAARGTRRRCYRARAAESPSPFRARTASAGRPFPSCSAAAG